jgi:hypothetical protein
MYNKVYHHIKESWRENFLKLHQNYRDFFLHFNQNILVKSSAAQFSKTSLTQLLLHKYLYPEILSWQQAKLFARELIIMCF